MFLRFKIKDVLRAMQFQCIKKTFQSTNINKPGVCGPKMFVLKRLDIHPDSSL